MEHGTLTQQSPTPEDDHIEDMPPLGARRMPSTQQQQQLLAAPQIEVEEYDAHPGLHFTGTDWVNEELSRVEGHKKPEVRSPFHPFQSKYTGQSIPPAPVTPDHRATLPSQMAKQTHPPLPLRSKNLPAEEEVSPCNSLTSVTSRPVSPMSTVESDRPLQRLSSLDSATGRRQGGASPGQAGCESRLQERPSQPQGHSSQGIEPYAMARGGFRGLMYQPPPRQNMPRPLHSQPRYAIQDTAVIPGQGQRPPYPFPTRHPEDEEILDDRAAPVPMRARPGPKGSSHAPAGYKPPRHARAPPDNMPPSVPDPVAALSPPAALFPPPPSEGNNYQHAQSGPYPLRQSVHGPSSPPLVQPPPPPPSLPQRFPHYNKRRPPINQVPTPNLYSASSMLPAPKRNRPKPAQVPAPSPATYSAFTQAGVGDGGVQEAAFAIDNFYDVGENAEKWEGGMVELDGKGTEKPCGGAKRPN